jgi:HlyD family secretion protein
MVRVAAPYFESRPSVVGALLVHENQWVPKGDAIAYLDGKPQLEAERARVMAQLELERLRLAQVRAGSKASDVEAQRAQVERLESAYRFDRLRLDRYEALFQSKYLSKADLEAQQSAAETAGKALEEAQHRLASLQKVPEQDVRVAEGSVAVQEGQLREIEARLAALTVIAPISGRVIRVHANQGEQVTQEGIVELADTRRMAVEAEVYAADLALVKLGQQASIEVEGGGAELQGVVTRVGAEVQQASVLTNDPVQYSDAQIVPVRIRIDGCREGMCPIDARVKVIIQVAQ